MPLLSSLIVAAALGWQTPPAPKETKTYSDPLTSIQFDYPKEWRYRREKLFNKLEFPGSDGKKVEVQLLGSDFRQPPQQWQDIQVEINTTARKLVERQWEEVILGVPLLLTKLVYREGDVEYSTLVGLLYSKTAEKFNFRLTATAAAFPEAEAKWREVLTTMRTIDGKLPGIENGDTDVRLVEGGANPDHTFVLAPETPGAKQNLKGLRASPISALGANLLLYMPKSWEVESQESGFLLKNKDLKGKATLEVSAGGVTEAQSRLLQAMEGSMDRFTTISLRKEYEVKGTKAGCVLARSERFGTEGESPLVVVYAAGVRGGSHWFLTYEVKSMDDWKDDRNRLEQLFDGMVVQAAAP